MQIPILYQCADFVIINKPAGILVHRHHRFPNERPILQRIRDQLGQHVWLVHRLDRQTSGCLIIALRSQVVEELALALQAGQKTYWAFVRGYFPTIDPVVINTPIKVSDNNYQPAESTVQCIGRSVEPRCSLLEVLPKTGRNHQVRRHVRDLHHPILHDGDHGDSRVNRFWRENRGLSRLALHAGKLEFQYKNQHFFSHAALADDLQNVFQGMPWWDNAVVKEPYLIATTVPP